jgi:hypothetical protein
VSTPNKNAVRPEAPIPEHIRALMAEHERLAEIAAVAQADVRDKAREIEAAWRDHNKDAGNKLAATLAPKPKPVPVTRHDARIDKLMKAAREGRFDVVASLSVEIKR